MAHNPKNQPLELIRHSTAHLMAAAIADLYPGTKFGIGPDIEDGFYYDLELPDGVKLTLEDLPAIEARMRELVAADEPFVRKEMSKDDALALFADQDYKLELIDELPADEVLSVYTTGAFTDLCRGPHVPSTGYLKHFKLTKLAGAYWRGSSDRPMLQRIYGTAWQKASQLSDYLERQAEAERRDHRKLGKELDLFSFHELAGSGLPLYHPKGARVLRLLQEWLRRVLYARGYVEAITPHIYKVDVWKTSGHYENYKNDMYFFDVFEDEGQDEGRSRAAEGKVDKVSEYAVKPMNCPGHIMIYASDLHSYRDLPLRMFEFGTVYRHELSGVVHGLMRARGFTQDDAHIFCRPDQVNTEVLLMLELVDYVMGVFGFEYSAELSTRPEKKFIGTPETWEFTTAALENALKERRIPYEINEGDGAFYGPKIDIKLRDAIGRTWQCSTIQFDALLPERFGLEYRTADNSVERPMMLHRTILGSMERFFGILIEHYAGALPSWLAPVQAEIIPISDDQAAYAQSVADALASAGLRAEVDASNERMQAKIARAQAQRVPYMLVIGKREAEEGTVAVRHRTDGDKGAMALDAFIQILRDEEPAVA
ncbi:MAG: threonine--tRNA ligase [Actinomycetes bacterium]|jgi:threonyl-tRNA synthetase|nr:threonine--tRNA ligase [Actinomycetes bacterium]